MDSVLLPIVFALLAGLGAGAAAAAMLARGRHARQAATASQHATDLTARLDERSRRVDDLERALVAATADGRERRAGEARLEAELKAERAASADKLAIVNAAESALREAFRALSADALRTNNATFLELAKATLGELQQNAAGDLEHRRQAIDELVKPIRESLDRVGAQLHTVEKERHGAYTALGEQVRSLASTQQQLYSETANLVRALRTPTVRGRWGEMQLRRVVELAGMLPHCDFHEQLTISTPDGRRRPDLVVRLPGGRDIVVDAKAPLLAYLDALEATDEALRDANLKEHARQVREHVTQLGAKSYWAQFQPSPEFVVMFLPAETFFNAALQHDPGLIEFAAERRVVLASPTNLIALLYAIAHGWQQQAVAANVLELSELGKSLYDRLRTMVGHFDALRRSLDGATDAYNRVVGSLEGRVLVAARRFKELGTSLPEMPTLERVDRVGRQFDLELDAAGDQAASAVLEPPIETPVR